MLTQRITKIGRGIQEVGGPKRTRTFIANNGQPAGNQLPGQADEGQCRVSGTVSTLLCAELMHHVKFL